MSKEQTAVLRSTEAADSVAVQAVQGKTLKTHPDLDSWSSKELNDRKMEITNRHFQLQPLIMKADRKIYLTNQELNASTNEGDSEAAAKLVFVLSEARRELATLNTEKRKLAAEKQLLEREYKFRQDRLHDSPKIFLADGKMTRVS
jgi:hypothetical protein